MGNIVIGFDESPESVSAVRWGTRWAQTFGARVTILYAVDPGLPIPFRRLAAGSAVAQAADSVADRGAQLVRSLNPGLDVHGVGVVGQPPAELIALSQKADLVVVGRRGRGGPGSDLGSVSFALGAHARCPVVIVQGSTEIELGPDRPVVVGVDTVRSSSRALAFGAKAAAAHNADLVIASTWEPSRLEPWMLDAFGNAVPQEAALDTDRQRADTNVRDAAEIVARAHPELRVSVQTPQGTPAEELLATACSAGLLAVGSRGRGGFVGLMLGSVSRSVLRQAELPVAVVSNNPS